MRIITSGQRFLDIDGYAACVAYAELLRLQNFKAVAASSAPLNESIPPSLRALDVQFETHYQPDASDTFTLIDLSDPDHFDSMVDLSRVDEVIDHHPGFEAHWQRHPGVKADIEFIGAACTQVYERWRDAKLLDQLSPASANLLAAGILDNTLNFGAQVTTDRDRVAYQDLKTRANLTNDWPAQYFSECERVILADLETSVRNDSKVLSFQTFDQSISVGQLVVWDATPVLAQKTAIKSVLKSLKPHWFINVISLRDRRSYLVSDDSSIQTWLSKLLDTSFNDTVASANRLWLRKEIIKQDLNQAEPS